jgi:hypothetical protein
MQVLEHSHITAKHRAQAFYYRRWYRCMHEDCKTNFVMPEHFKIFNPDHKEGRTAKLHHEQGGSLWKERRQEPAEGHNPNIVEEETGQDYPPWQTGGKKAG